MTIEERNEFLTENHQLLLYFADKVNKTYHNISFDESLELVYFAAIRAAESWDPSKGTFTTQLIWRIKKELHMETSRRRAIFRTAFDTQSYDALERPEELVYSFGQRDDGEFEDKVINKAWIKWALAQLDDKELDVIKKHYWENKTLTEIGKEFGVSRQYISQIMSKALTKLNQLGEIDV